MKKVYKSIKIKTFIVICMLSLLMGIFQMSSIHIYAIDGLAIGDYVSYGRYKGQPIIWQVIHMDEAGNPLLFSKDIISYKAFDGAEIEDVEDDNEFRSEYGNNNYMVSNIREWLNSDQIIVDYSTTVPSEVSVQNGNNPYDYEKGFLSGFSDTEILGILTYNLRTTISLEDMRYKLGGSEAHIFEYGIPRDVINNYNEAYFSEIQDKVFLLSLDEISQYVEGNGLPIIKYPTLEASLDDQSGRASIDRTSAYWLRTPTSTSATAVRTITTEGFVNYDNAYYSNTGIVPGLYLDNSICTVSEGDGSEESPYNIRVNAVEAYFSDINLESAVREALEKPSGTLYVSELLRITELDASSKQITDLVGIEQLKNLEHLDLSYNYLESFEDMAYLNQLKEVELQYNDMKTLDFVAEFLLSSRIIEPLSINMTGNPVDLTDESVLSVIDLLSSLNVTVNFFEDLAINDDIKAIISTYEGSLNDETRANEEKEELTRQLEVLLDSVGFREYMSPVIGYETDDIIIAELSRDVVAMKREMSKQLKQNGINLNRDLETRVIISLPSMTADKLHNITVSEETMNQLFVDHLVIRTMDYELVLTKHGLINDFIRNDDISFEIVAESQSLVESTVNHQLSDEDMSVNMGKAAQNMSNAVYAMILSKEPSMLTLLNDITIEEVSRDIPVYNLQIYKDDEVSSSLYGYFGLRRLNVTANPYTSMFYQVDNPENMGGSYMSNTYYIEGSRSGTYALMNNKMAIDDVYDANSLDLIEYLVSKDILTLEDNHFKGDENITRAEVAASLVKLSELYDPNATYYFKDVSVTHDLYSYIASSANRGIVSGYGDGLFKPDNDITKGEFIKMLGAILAYKKGYIYPEDSRSYITYDNNYEISDWLESYLALCIREGIIEADAEMNFDENEPLTRLEAASLLYLLNERL